MNATERARRSDSLYYDTMVTNRRALCDMIANLESDLEDSKARNAKTFEVGKRWMAKAARFESENTKLRELLDYALPIAMYAASTEESDRMRELMRGIGE